MKRALFPALHIGFSLADDIERLDKLKKSGSITEDEFAHLRRKLVA